jgi:hypothetical protein
MILVTTLRRFVVFILTLSIVAGCQSITAHLTPTPVPRFDGRLILLAPNQGVYGITSTEAGVHVETLFQSKFIDPMRAYPSETVSGDKRYLVLTYGDLYGADTVGIMDLQNGEIIPLDFIEAAGAVRCVSWSPDSSMLVLETSYRDIGGLFTYNMLTEEVMLAYVTASEVYSVEGSLSQGATNFAPVGCGRDVWIDTDHLLFRGREEELPASYTPGTGALAPDTSYVMKLSEPPEMIMSTQEPWFLQDTCNSYLLLSDGEANYYLSPSRDDFFQQKAELICSDCEGTQFVPEQCDVFMPQYDEEADTLQIAFFDREKQETVQGALIPDISSYSISFITFIDDWMPTLIRGVWVGNPDEHLIAFVAQGNNRLHLIDLDTGEDTEITFNVDELMTGQPLHVMAWMAE